MGDMLLLKDHELFAELHPTKNTHLDYSKVKSKSNKIAYWVCSKGHEYPSKIANRIVLGRGCKYCTGQVPIRGENDLWTVNPELAGQLKDPDLGYGLFDKSNKKVDWVCPEGHVWTASVYVRHTSGCPYCSGRYPIPGETDLGTTHPEVADQLKDQMLRTTIKVSSSKKVTWVCKYLHEWDVSPNSRYRVINGVESFSGCPLCSGRKAIIHETSLSATHPEMYKQLVVPDPTLKFGSTVKVDWICPAGHTFNASPNHRTKGNGNHLTGCPHCSGTISGPERQLKDFLSESFNGVVRYSVRNVIPPKELDIYFPELNLAVEFNGTYYHSEKFKSRDYHSTKVRLCQEKGIQLIQIWEDDYLRNPELVLSTLSHKLGVSSQRKVPARKTYVSTISYHEARDFLESNHLQGSARGTYYLGLKTKDSDTLVAVMVLRRVKDVLTLDRYATSCIVAGGQSKLLSYVDGSIPHTSLYTFADLEVSNGNLYETTGWVKDKVLPPDYKYLYRNRRVHKFNFRKDRFKSNPELKYDPNMTESQLAQLNGLLRVWDSGKIRYVRTPN